MVRCILSFDQTENWINLSVNILHIFKPLKLVKITSEDGSSFTLIYTLQSTALGFKKKYPKTNCADYKAEYSNRRSAWMKDSINEYLINNKIEDKGEVALYTGPM